MTSCFVCKKDVGENDYLLFTFDRSSDGYFTIKEEDPSKHGLAIIVCKDCQRRMIADQVRNLLEKGGGIRRPSLLDQMRERMGRLTE